MHNIPATILLFSALTLATLHSPTFAQETSNDTATPATQEASSLATETKPSAGTVADGAPPATLPENEVPIKFVDSTRDGQRYPDLVLREVHPKHRARDVGFSIVMAFMGGLHLPALSNNAYNGEKIEAVEHPAKSGLTEGLRAAIRHWQQVNGKQNAVYKNPFTIRLDRFALLYRDLSAEQTIYDLYIETTVSRKPDSSSWFSGPEEIHCSTEDTDRNFTLDQWTAKDYERVRALGRDHVKSCIEQVASSLDKLMK